MTFRPFLSTCALAFLFVAHTAKAETFIFELENPTLDCDGTDYEIHLEKFNLQCIDGLGCEPGSGILGAGAHVIEHGFPTTVHVVIEGCHAFPELCPEDTLDTTVQICDDVAGLGLDEDQFCSSAHREDKFGIGIPLPHTLLPPLGPFDVKAVNVILTLDDINFCRAEYHVHVEENFVTGLLAVGAPLIGIGVGFLAGATYFVKYWQQQQQQQQSANKNKPPLILATDGTGECAALDDTVDIGYEMMEAELTGCVHLGAAMLQDNMKRLENSTTAPTTVVEPTTKAKHQAFLPSDALAHKAKLQRFQRMKEQMPPLPETLPRRNVKKPSAVPKRKFAIQLPAFVVKKQDPPTTE